MPTKRRGRHEKHHKSPKERSPSPVQSSDSDPELDNDDEQRSYQPTSPAQWSHHRHSINSIASVSNIQAGSKGSSGAMIAAGLPPELLIHVFRQLTDIADYHNCLFVSRTWCQCAVELLWLKPHLTSVKALNDFLRVISPGFVPPSLDNDAERAFDSREAVLNGRWRSMEDVDHDSDAQNKIDGAEHKEEVSINRVEDYEPCFPYARFVRRLNLSGVAEDLYDAHFRCLSACTRLERFTLNGCIHLTDKSLSILSGMTELVALDLTGVVDVSDATIISLANSSNKLQGINLEGCKKVTDEGIFAMANAFPLLRRIKLCELENITGASVSKLVKSCPLLIEIDLNACAGVNDAAVRDIWVSCLHLRELRLAQCARVGDLAFPVPPKVAAPINTYAPPSNSTGTPDSGPLARLTIPLLPPLFLNQQLTHLRQLDLMQLSITDEAVAGIIANSPKLRNLVLAKCSALTDEAVRSISELGRHLQFLHLGHAISITDDSIMHLVNRCARLRYVDLACCPSLTNKSVKALAALPKLRRVGLVRVFNLTDEAVDALSARGTTLERVHLSYCEKITVPAIHRLLVRLTKLTHLSLTGVPAFKKSELQRFCRPPPSNFNETQRAAFCVYSGNGINQLRRYLESTAPKIAYGSRNEEDEHNMSLGEHGLSETDEDGQEVDANTSGLFAVAAQGPGIPLSYPPSGSASQSQSASPTPPPGDYHYGSGAARNGHGLHGISRSHGNVGTSRARLHHNANNEDVLDAPAPVAHAGMISSPEELESSNTMRHRTTGAGTGTTTGTGSTSTPFIGHYLRSKLQRTPAREDGGATAMVTGTDLSNPSRRTNHFWSLPSTTNGTAMSSQSSHPHNQSVSTSDPTNSSSSVPSAMHAMIRSRNGGSTSRRLAATTVSPSPPLHVNGHNTNQVGTTGSDSVLRNVNQSTLPSSSQRIHPLHSRAQALIQAGETNWTSDSSREGEGEGDAEKEDAEGDLDAELSMSSRSPMRTGTGTSSSAHDECEETDGKNVNTPIKGYDISDDTMKANRKGIQQHEQYGPHSRHGHAPNSASLSGFPLHDSPEESRNSTPSPSRLNRSGNRVRRSIKVGLSVAENYATSLFRGKGKGNDRDGNYNSAPGSRSGSISFPSSTAGSGILRRSEDH